MQKFLVTGKPLFERPKGPSEFKDNKVKVKDSLFLY